MTNAEEIKFWSTQRPESRIKSLLVSNYFPQYCRIVDRGKGQGFTYVDFWATDEGKPLYKIIGEIKSTVPRHSITMSTLKEEVEKISNFKFTSLQLKSVIFYLNWVTIEHFKIEHPPEGTVSSKFNTFIWIEVFDEIKKTDKVVFAKEAIKELATIINNKNLHNEIFKKDLELKKSSIMGIGQK